MPASTTSGVENKQGTGRRGGKLGKEERGDPMDGSLHGGGSTQGIGSCPQNPGLWTCSRARLAAFCSLAQPYHRTDSLAAESRHRIRPLAADPVAQHAARCNAKRQKGRLQEAGRKILALLSPPPERSAGCLPLSPGSGGEHSVSGRVARARLSPMKGFAL